MAELKCKISKHMTPGRCVKNQIEAEEIFGDRASECNSCPCDQGREIRNNTSPVIPAVSFVTEAEILAAGESQREVKSTMSSMTKEGICTNCERKRLIIRAMGICYTCQKAAQGKKSDARVQALADIKEKILRGAPVTRKSVKSRKVEAKPEIKPESGVDSGGSTLQVAAEVEEASRHSGPDPESRTIIQPIKYIESISENAIILLFETDADQKLREVIEIQARQYRRTPDQQILWLCQNEIKIHNELLKEAAEDYVARKSQAMEAGHG